jgi:hypothetical protein
VDKQDDYFPVSELMDRYGLVRSQIYARINALKERDPDLSPFKIGVKSYLTGNMLKQMDAMHQLIRDEGFTTDQAADHLTDSPSPRIRSSLKNQYAESTENIATTESAAIAAIKQALQTQPFARYEMLDRLAEKGWRLPGHELAALLERDELADEPFEQYGYRFTKAKDSGSEDDWTVEKT